MDDDPDEDEEEEDVHMKGALADWDGTGGYCINMRVTWARNELLGNDDDDDDDHEKDDSNE